jgi:hypothetical protein
LFEVKSSEIMRYHNVSTRYELKLAKLTTGNIFLLVALDTTEQRCETVLLSYPLKSEHNFQDLQRAEMLVPQMTIHQITADG